MNLFYYCFDDKNTYLNLSMEIKIFLVIDLIFWIDYDGKILATYVKHINDYVWLYDIELFFR